MNGTCQSCGVNNEDITIIEKDKSKTSEKLIAPSADGGLETFSFPKPSKSTVKGWECEQCGKFHETNIEEVEE